MSVSVCYCFDLLSEDGADPATNTTTSSDSKEKNAMTDFFFCTNLPGQAPSGPSSLLITLIDGP